MTALTKEMLEYQRAIIELPRFVMSGVAIFATAASFFIRDLPEDQVQSVVMKCLYIIGMVLTLLTFSYGFKLSTGMVNVMRCSPNTEDARSQIDQLITGDYRVFSWIGAVCILSWVIVIFLMALS